MEEFAKSMTASEQTAKITNLKDAEAEQKEEHVLLF